jgi:hypothetical protein
MNGHGALDLFLSSFFLGVCVLRGRALLWGGEVYGRVETRLT